MHPTCSSFSLSTCVVWTHCSLCSFVQHRPHMGDVVVHEDEWWKLYCELCGIREDAGKVKSFMVKHASTKWKVESECVGL